jgi:hypothetical protein
MMTDSPQVNMSAATEITVLQTVQVLKVLIHRSALWHFAPVHQITVLMCAHCLLIFMPRIMLSFWMCDACTDAL